MKFLDLSRTVDERTPPWPGDPLFQATPFATHSADGFHGTRYSIGSHLGTHVDAPFHYFVDGETLDSFPVDFFVGEAACLDMSAVAGADSKRFKERDGFGRPATIDVADLEPFEDVFENVPIILIRTGWSKQFGEWNFYMDFPSLPPETCDWLADYPKLRIIGMESPSLVAEPNMICDRGGDCSDDEPDPQPIFDPELTDCLPSSGSKNPRDPERSERSLTLKEPEPLSELELCADAESHRILLGRRPPVVILEGLASLDELPAYVAQATPGERAKYDPARSFRLSCFPLPIADADGSPVRAVAEVNE